MFWFICLALTLMVGAVITQPLWASAPRLAPDDAARARTLFDRQQSQIDADLKAGLISAPEAETRRAATARRLIAASRGQARSLSAASALPAAGMVLLLGGASLAAYWQIGAPGYPDMPLTDRLRAAETARAERPSQAEMAARLPASNQPTPDQDYLDIVTRLREAVAENPQDARGLGYLARHEASLGNFEAAIEAQTRLIALRDGAASPAEKLILLDLMVYQTHGYVSPESEALARGILAQNPRSTGARYYLGLLFDQTGRPDLAFDHWIAVIREAPPSDSYADLARRFIGDAAARAGIPYDAEVPVPPPGQSAEDQAAMIGAMVEGLAERLASEGGPAQDWARLIRALGVLGQTDRATAIWREAQQVFAADSAALALINEAGAGLAP